LEAWEKTLETWEEGWEIGSDSRGVAWNMFRFWLGEASHRVPEVYVTSHEFDFLSLLSSEDPGVSLFALEAFSRVLKLSYRPIKPLLFSPTVPPKYSRLTARSGIIGLGI
jgi:hypothetical protein